MNEPIKTVKMHKLGQRVGYPSNADVHPDEVANWQKTGWIISRSGEEVEDSGPFTEAAAAPAEDAKMPTKRGAGRLRKTSA